MTRRPRGPARDRGFLGLGTGARVRLDPEPIASIDAVRDAMAERDFQAGHVVKVLEEHGWQVTTFPEMRLSLAGWPDVTAWHPNVPGLLLLWELKVKGRKPRPAQEQTLAHLRTVPGVDARVVRPRDWPRLRDVLLDTSGDPRAALAAIREEEP